MATPDPDAGPRAVAEPKCPGCGIRGGEHLVSRDSQEANRAGDAWFNIVHCDDCGHVYGVFVKHVLPPATPIIPRGF